jgi:toxin FitB
MYLLDTNVVSELRKSRAGKANPGVVEWSRAIPAVSMFISVITLFELEHGVLQAERSDPAKGAILRQWLDREVVTAFEHRMQPVNNETALRAASLHVPDPVPYADALIAATALVNDWVVVTRNIEDFRRFDRLEIINPWS